MPEALDRPAAESPPDAAPEVPVVTSTEVPVVTSAEVLRGAREVRIQHGTEYYRLRLTSKDRLILTK